MSKSISGGLGAINLTIQELRLIDGKFTDLTATNGTISNQLNGNDATFTGTISTNNFSVSGTFSVSNLTVSGLIDAYKLDVENELKYKTEDTDNRYIRKSGSTNETITGTKTFSNNVICNSSVATNELKGLNDVSIYARAGSDFAYAEKLKINVTNSTFYNDVIIGTATNNENLTVYGTGIYSGGLVSASLGTTGAITKNSVTVLNQTESDARYIQQGSTDFNITNLTASGFVKISNTLNESSSSSSRPLLFLNADNKIAVNSNLSFVASTAKINASSISVTGNIEGNNIKLNSMVSPSTGTSVEYPLIFHGFNNHLQKASSGLTYNNSSNTLTVENIEATLNTSNIRTLSNGKIEFDSGTIEDHGSDVYLGFKSSGNSLTAYNIALWNDGHVRFVSSGSSGFRFYMASTQGGSTVVEEVFRINNSDIKIVRPLLIDDATALTSPDTTTDTEHKLIFSGENGYVQKASNTLTYNNSNDTLTCTRYVGSHLTISGQLSFNPSNSTISRQQRILFYDVTDDYTKSSDILTYNPSSKILTVGNINVTESQIEIPNPVDIGTANRDCHVMIHDGATGGGGDNVLKIANTKLTYNGSSNGVLSCPNLRITAMGTYTADQDRNIPYLNNINKLCKSSNFTFNGSSETLSCPNLNIATELKYKNEDIDSRYIQTGVDKVITNKYTFTKLNLGALPINYSECIECLDAFNMVNSYDSANFSNSSVAGNWGASATQNDMYMSFKFNDALVTQKMYSPTYHTQTYAKWLWETDLTAQGGSPITYVINTAFFGKYFYLYTNNIDTTLNGSAWRLNLSLRFRNNSTNRIAPSVVLVKELANGFKWEYQLSEHTGYIRASLARFSTIECNHILDNVLPTDKYYFKLICARAGNTTFQSILTPNEWRIQYFKQSFKYLGNLERSTVTNPRNQDLNPSGGGG
jgi:hypothetical protein